MSRKKEFSDENWKLFPYDYERLPQEIFHDDTECTVTSRSLHKEFMCPICLEILKKTMTSKECLHRFCRQCITTALRHGNKECPTCRKKLISKRSLRPDVNFDLLITNIYPNLDEYEAQYNETVAHLNTSYMKALSNNIKMDNANKSNKSKENASSSSSKENLKNCRKFFSISEHLSNSKKDNNCHRDSYQSTTNNAQMQITVLDEIELILKPYTLVGSMYTNEPRYIKTATSATVNHLKKYLLMRMNLDCDSNSTNFKSNLCLMMNNISMYIANQLNQLIPLNGTETLEQLKNEFGKDDQPLIIFFAITQIYRNLQC